MADSAQLNILIETGADFVLPWRIKDNNGDPVDLTDSTITSHLRRFAEDADFFEFICRHNGKGGRITITMPKEATSQISFPEGVYDVRVTLADGMTSYPLAGKVIVRPGVTKPIDGSVLFMIGVTSYDDLPSEGVVNRLYYCYDDRKIYRWNGVNYIGTAVGNGVQKVEFVRHADEFSDVYRMYFDDGTYFEYVVTSKGVDHVAKINSSGDEYTGVVDTYRMYFSNGTYWDYQVTNGKIMYATFEVDWDSGHLVMATYNMPSGLFPEFDLNEYGHMVMETEPVIPDVEEDEE